MTLQNSTTVNYMVIKKSLNMLNLLKIQFHQIISTKYIANLGRKPYIPLHSYIIEDMADIGFLMRGEIIWNKASSSSPSTAWGSWLSAGNPVLRDIHEYILIFSKESFSRKRGNKKDTIAKEDFLEWTKSVWTFPAVSARNVQTLF